MFVFGGAGYFCPTASEELRLSKWSVPWV